MTIIFGHIGIVSDTLDISLVDAGLPYIGNTGIVGILTVVYRSKSIGAKGKQIFKYAATTSAVNRGKGISSHFCCISYIKKPQEIDRHIFAYLDTIIDGAISVFKGLAFATGQSSIWQVGIKGLLGSCLGIGIAGFVFAIFCIGISSGNGRCISCILQF